jgi:hypothetical protein
MLLLAIEAMYPGKRLIHVLLDNARYHHAKQMQQWLDPDEPNYSKASGSCRVYLATGSISLRLVARGPAPVTRSLGSVPCACVAGPRSSRSPPFAPPATPPVVQLRSLASLLLWRSQVRASSATTPRLPDADPRVLPRWPNPRFSRFPHKERPHPGSPTTPG